MRIGVRQWLLRDRCWMLDARCWIFRNVLIVKSKNIQYQVSCIQYPASGIQHRFAIFCKIELSSTRWPASTYGGIQVDRRSFVKV
jgi:hypothetical protein